MIYFRNDDPFRYEAKQRMILRENALLSFIRILRKRIY